jgi:hypothetical protein
MPKHLTRLSVASKDGSASAITFPQTDKDKILETKEKRQVTLILVVEFETAFSLT